MSLADSTLHLCILWRLHKSWLLAVPPKSGTLVEFKHVVVAAVLVSIQGIAPCRSGIWTSRITAICRFRPRSTKPGDCGCLFCWITRNPLQRHVCPQLSRHDIPVGTSFVNKIGSVKLEVVPFSVCRWERRTSTGGERESASYGERERASCRSKLWSWRKIPGPRQRFGAGSLDIAQSHILMSSSRSLSWFRGQSFQILCECDGVPHCDGKRHQHRLEQLQRTCHVHVITERHVSQGWRHEQQLSIIGLRRQVLRSRGRIVSNEVFFKFFTKLGEKFSCRRAVRLPLHSLGASMPCGAHHVPEQGSIEPVSVELWRRYQRRR